MFTEVSSPFCFVSKELHSTTRLDDVLVLACQHLLQTTLPMFEALFSQGLKPEQCFVLGKCYSTHQASADELRTRGVYVSPLSSAFDSHQTFDEQFSEYIFQFLEEVKTRVDIHAFRRIVILDDGGRLIEAAQQVFPTEHLVGVEQTSSGYTRLARMPLHIPVINIARSRAKLEIESPLIARIVVKEIEVAIKKARLVDPSILVIGKGPIGNEIQMALRRTYRVSGCDLVADRCDFQGVFKTRLNDFEVIIGATGAAALTKEDIQSIQRRVLLISASSSDREFPSAWLRQQLPKTSDCHGTVSTGNNVLVRSGFPINFTGGPYSLPPSESAFTCSLLFSGVCQSIEQVWAPGFQDLNVEHQEGITSFFRATQEQ